MTNEDKQLICEYMGWTYHVTDDGKWWNCIGPKGGNHLLDSNDASLVVAEMQKRGEWDEFKGSASFQYYQKNNKKEWFITSHTKHGRFTAWLMSMEEGQARNFFKAFYEWRKGK